MKIIRIKACGSCYWCKYLIYDDNKKYYIYECKNYKGGEYITDTTVLPNWCPLEDEKE